MNDPINPQHYRSKGIECVDIMKGFGLDLHHIYIGNIIKYLYRYEDKGGSQDLEKAKWYLEKLIKEVKEEEILGENEQTGRS